MQSNTQPPLPSVEELLAMNPNAAMWPTVAFLRVRMTIPGPLDSAVVVVDEPHDPDSSFVPYYQTLHNGPSVKHPISEEPVTYPVASSFATTVDEFEDGPTIWRFANHIDVESDCDEEDRLVCSSCGAKGPIEPDGLTVRAISKPFVTVDDWISQVYEYLMMHEDTIRRVTYTDNEKDYPEAGKLEVCKVTYYACTLHEVQGGEAARGNGLTAEYMDKVKRATGEAEDNSGV